MWLDLVITASSSFEVEFDWIKAMSEVKKVVEFVCIALPGTFDNMSGKLCLYIDVDGNIKGE